MKSFVKTTLIAVCTVLIIQLVFVIGILGYRNIEALIHGVINISLVLEFVGVVIIFGIIIGVFGILENDKKNDYYTCRKPDQPADPFAIKRITETEFEAGVEDLAEKIYGKGDDTDECDKDG